MGRVLAPCNGKGAAAALVAAGAGELYLGFFDNAWTDAFGPNAPLNRLSGFGQNANALSFEEMLDEIWGVVDDCIARSEEPPHAFCVFNAARYSTEQADFIASRYFPALADAGFTGVILSGPELIEAAHDQGLYAVASTMCAIYNEDLARFYRDCGMDRIILPRDMQLGAIAAVMNAVPELDYEVFLMRNGCIFADSHCMGLHKADQPALCRTLRESPCWNQLSADVFAASADASASTGAPTSAGASASAADASTWDSSAFWSNDAAYKQTFHLNTCGLCALWQFEQLGVSAYKVVGRCDALDDLCDDVALTARNVAIAQQCETEADFLASMERPDDLLLLCQNQGLSCYYPDVRFGAVQ